MGATAGGDEAAVPGLSLASVVGRGGERNERQKDIASRASQKLAGHRQLGPAGVSAAGQASAAKAKAKAKPKAKAKAAAQPQETVFYAHGLPDLPPLTQGRRWCDRVMQADVVVVRDLAVLQKAKDSYVRLDRPLLAAMLFGKRVAVPMYCWSTLPGAGTSCCFRPCLTKKFGIFFTARFAANHSDTLNMFRQAARQLGAACKVDELDTEDNARALGTDGGMVVDGLNDFSTVVRKLASVAPQRTDRGTYRRGYAQFF